MKKTFLLCLLAFLIVGCGANGPSLGELNSEQNHSQDSAKAVTSNTIESIEEKPHEIKITADNFNDFFSITSGNLKRTQDEKTKVYTSTIDTTVKSYRKGFVYYVGTITIKVNLRTRNLKDSYSYDSYIERNFSNSFTISFDETGSGSYSNKWEGKNEETPYVASSGSMHFTYKVINSDLKAIYIDSGISGDSSLTYESYEITKYNFAYYFSISIDTTYKTCTIKPIDSARMYDYDVEITYNVDQKIRLHRDGTYTIDGISSFSLVDVSGSLDVYPDRIV